MRQEREAIMKAMAYVLVIGILAVGPVALAGGKAKRSNDSDQTAADAGKKFEQKPAVARVTGRSAPVVQAQTIRRPTEQRRVCEPAAQPVINEQPSQSTIVIVNVTDDAAMAEYLNEQIQGFYQPGYDWGALLKGYQIDWAEFVPLLRKYVVEASEVGRDAFRRGFIAGFGTSAEAVYGNALRQACRRS